MIQTMCLCTLFLSFPVAQQPNSNLGRLILEVSRSHTIRHTAVRTPLDEGSARRRDLYVTTPNTHKRENIHAPGGIRTHNPSKRGAADPRLRPRSHWDRLMYTIEYIKPFSFTVLCPICCDLCSAIFREVIHT
jgi:hypothetical protein